MLVFIMAVISLLISFCFMLLIMLFYNFWNAFIVIKLLKCKIAYILFIRLIVNFRYAKNFLFSNSVCTNILTYK